MTMKTVRLWVVAALVLASASPVLADRHKAGEIVRAFVGAWNSGDSADMATLWTADAQSDVLGRDVVGREAIARAFAETRTTFKLTEMSQQSGRRRVVVQLEGEI